MIPNGWRVDKVHKCGAKRLVNAQGHVTTVYQDRPLIVPPGECAHDGQTWCQECTAPEQLDPVP